MTANEISELSAVALRERVVRREVKALQVANAALATVETTRGGEGGLNYLLWSDPAAVRAEAEANDVRMDANPPSGAVAGVPFVVKDNIATLGLPTTCGSRILEGYVSPYEATAVRRLRGAGAIVLGKSNMDEFGMGSSTEFSAYGPTRNPIDPDRVPGGSSGGSAAAVAAGATRIALGSETGGSVRQPAAFCGVVGVKPTYGRVSRYGLVAFASSLDHVGIFGRTVDDAALALEVIAGRDRLDATSSDAPVPLYREAARERLDGIVVGRPAEYFPDVLDGGIAARCDRVFDVLRELGAEVRDVSLPHTSLAIPVYYIIAPAEASANLARFDGARFGLRVEADDLAAMYAATRSTGFGAEVTRRILLGTYVLSAGYYDAYYRQAQAVRTLIAEDFERVFGSGVHALVTPTTPTTAFRLGATVTPYEMYLNDVYTVTANLAGVPALSLPIGRVAGLPVGGQVIAGHLDEASMFGVAYALERALGAEAHG